MAQTHHPLISIIIPVYNVAPYLREALDSAVNQTYENLEILIIDDGSTDGSGDICDEYSLNFRVQVFHQKNKGVSNARNVGLDRAAGDFIAFLDPDDAYHPEFIQMMLEAIQNADIAECQFTNHQLVLDSEGQTVLTAKEGGHDRVKALRSLIDRKLFSGVCNKLFRKELWNEIRFPEGHFYEDFEVVCNTFNLINRLYYLDQSLYLRRIRPGSTTQTFSRKMAEDWKLSYDRRIAFLESHIPEIFDEMRLNRTRQLRMVGMIRFYIKGAADVEDLRAACDGVDPKECSYKRRMVYHTIRYCPRLLKIFYPVYHPFRMLVWKVFGR